MTPVTAAMDADAIVDDAHDDHLILTGGADRDVTALWRVLGGVCK